ncbi:hypothetical protein C2E25_06285 [Geothermobacter hydrogeniphilus]|uniref:Uncharacterized protein n=1 Tax=Geothermobacter hydrogeniphilus TaxID=1969733 RepID=A0A2K2HBP8_9BACT|nr:hypothetical protein [Geothermobacter hydrogeniphilus]PNU20649.1 hypothetical protein C2E25_06285 [Geothermobacter hydrogeniphilus]
MLSYPVRCGRLSIIFFAAMLMLATVGRAEELRYTRFNIHAQVKSETVAKASYANYTNPSHGHIIIPAGTKVVVKDKSRKKIVFGYAGDTKTILFDYHAPRMQMSVDEYLEKITSSTPVFWDHFSTLDKEGIAKGKVLPGMTREGVMTALGYPATHRTPSLEAATWIYWTNRFGTIGRFRFGWKGSSRSRLR